MYNVSGEYSMVIGSTQEGAQRKAMVQEIFYSFARAGADVIVTTILEKPFMAIGLIEVKSCSA